MAMKTLQKTRLQIRLTDQEGNTTKLFSLSRIDLEAGPSELLKMAKAIAGLQTLPVQEYRLIDTSTLSD